MAGEEKTALEIILELPSILKKIENKIDVLDTNLKILNNKLNKIKNQDSIIESSQNSKYQEAKKESDSPALPDTAVMPTATPGPIESIPGGMPNLKTSQKLILGSIKVFSKIKTASGKAVDGMTVNIFDKSNELIRNLVTDKEGYWECKLPPGVYSVEMLHPKLKTINKEIDLKKDIKSYEVV
jgi:hypothetical protein